MTYIIEKKILWFWKMERSGISTLDVAKKMLSIYIEESQPPEIKYYYSDSLDDKEK